MGWETSDRHDRLPDDWPWRVSEVKKRDKGQCTWRLPSGKRCPRRGTDVDHRVPGDNHDLRNLQLLCPHHHGKKTAREGVAGRRPPKRNRHEEPPPGLIR